jgi:hypothetical protein
MAKRKTVLRKNMLAQTNGGSPMKSLYTHFVIAFVLFFCSTGFGGTYSGGSGTAAEPYRIGTAADWVELVYTPGDQEKHFVLIADIDLAGFALQPIYNITTVPLTF